jgi:hypothetical protein
MKYDKKLADQIVGWYQFEGLSVPQIATKLSTLTGEIVPERSIIAKLSSLGVYKKKQYLTKRGEIPIKKSEYVEKFAKILNVDVEILESMEKLNKNVLVMLLEKLDPKPSE